MAELKNGLLNGASGNLGNMITYQRNGKYFVRTRPARVKQPNTEKQLVARKRFALLQPVNALLKEVYRFGFATDSKARPAYSAAVSWNLKHAIKDAYPNPELDFSQLLLFQGDRLQADNIRLQSVNNQLGVQWDHSVQYERYSQDRAVLILFSLEKKFLDFRLEAAKRSDAQLLYQGSLPEGGVHVYLSFYSQIPIKGTVSAEDVCPSYYCGMWNGDD